MRSPRQFLFERRIFIGHRREVGQCRHAGGGVEARNGVAQSFNAKARAVAQQHMQQAPANPLPNRPIGNPVRRFRRPVLRPEFSSFAAFCPLGPSRMPGIVGRGLQKFFRQRRSPRLFFRQGRQVHEQSGENRAGAFSFVHRPGDALQSFDQIGAIDRTLGDKSEDLVQFLHRTWRKSRDCLGQKPDRPDGRAILIARNAPRIARRRETVNAHSGESQILH